MSDPVIQVENLGKKYIIGHQQSDRSSRYVALRDVLAEGARSLGQRLRQPFAPVENPEREEFWALKDVSFEVKQGECVGIIGRNGAGKSTLLKILSRITEPTEGRIKIRGRVASLLEVGTGFHPELTGRENIYLNGAILGMMRSEIRRKFDEIVDFAEVEKFLDTPVKHYSSGMYVRLAFAVAAHLEPEILVVDEVLAVGDAAFQKKCLGKMGDVATKEGRTVLFVSHNMGTISGLCSRGILLQQGLIASDSSSQVAISNYLKDISDNASRKIVFKESTNQVIKFLEASIYSLGKDNIEKIDIFDNIIINIVYILENDVKGLNLGIDLKKEGTIISRSFDIDSNPSDLDWRKAGQYSVDIHLPKGLLSLGQYTIDIAAGFLGMALIVRYIDCLCFEIENLYSDLSMKSLSRNQDCLINLQLKWTTN